MLGGYFRHWRAFLYIYKKNAIMHNNFHTSFDANSQGIRMTDIRTHFWQHSWFGSSNRLMVNQSSYESLRVYILFCLIYHFIQLLYIGVHTSVRWQYFQKSWGFACGVKTYTPKNVYNEYINYFCENEAKITFSNVFVWACPFIHSFKVNKILHKTVCIFKQIL